MIFRIQEEKLHPPLKSKKPDMSAEALRDEAWNLSQQLSLVLNSELDERNLNLAERKIEEIGGIISKLKWYAEDRKENEDV